MTDGHDSECYGGRPAEPVIPRHVVEIERLRAKIERLRAALKPFADLATDAETKWDALPTVMRPSIKPTDKDGVTTTLGLCRAAREALRGNEQSGPGGKNG